MNDSQNSMESVEMDLKPSLYKYGQCTDAKSLRRVNVKDFLYENNNRILIISDGYKIGYRRRELDRYLEDNSNMYKDSSGNYYIYTSFGKMIKMSDFMNFYKDINRVFICRNLYDKIDIFTTPEGAIFQHPMCSMVSFSLEDYENL